MSDNKIKFTIDDFIVKDSCLKIIFRVDCGFNVPLVTLIAEENRIVVGYGHVKCPNDKEGYYGSQGEYKFPSLTTDMYLKTGYEVKLSNNSDISTLHKYFQSLAYIITESRGQSYIWGRPCDDKPEFTIELQQPKQDILLS